ncbi:gp53-like domain-containing protein [Cupriavidus basilensis]
MAATTGTQVTHAPDAGYTGLWVVPVANGQTTITSASIAQAANAPILPADLLHAIQQNALTNAVDTGSANTYAVSYTPAVTVGVDDMVVWFKVKTANTGASTLNVNGLGAQPLVGGAHSALQGGEMVANGKAQAVWRADIGSWALIECTGGALQVPAATQTNHAVNLGADDARYAALAGLANQLFAVSAPTATPHAVNLGEFAASLGTNGYVKIQVFAGGAKRTLIIQWGSVAAVSAGGGATWTFPIAFPNSYLGGVAAFNNTGGISGSAAGGIGNSTNANAVLFNNGSYGTSQISAIVVGW